MSMKKLLCPSILLLLLTLGNTFSAFSITTATTAAGAWTTAGNWNNGVPAGADIATVNTGNAMTGVGALALTSGGYYTIKANLSGGTSLSVASGSTFEVQAGTSTFSGAGTISGTLIVRSGATLNINTSITFSAGAIILIEAGGTLHTGGSFTNNSTSGVQVDGLISAAGGAANNGTIYGNGNVTSAGAMSNAGTMFGTTGGLGCAFSCNGNTLCATNTITASSPLCSGGAVSVISGNAGLGSYQWQSSATGADASYANIGVTTQNYTPGAVSTTTYYRRKFTLTLGLCTTNSPAIAVIMPTVSVSPATVSACANASSTVITATPLGGTSPYTYSWSPATNLTSTTVANPTASPTSTTTYTVSVHDNNNCGNATATSVFTITPLPAISQIPASLQSRYKLDGNALDAQGVNNGTLQNAPTATADRFGNANSAYSFDGSSQYISTTVSYTNPNQFSIAVWFQTTTSVGGRLVGFGDASTGASGNRDRMAWMDNTGNLVFAVNPGTGYELTSPKSYNDGSWHQLVITCSSTAGHGTNMYVDGALVATNTSALGGQNYTGYWRINYDGIGWTDSPTSNYFKGAMDDVMIFNAELTSGNITTLYNTPDGAGSNNPVCLGGSLNLTSTTIAGATYNWSGPNTFSSASQNPTVSNMSSVNEGVYAVTVTKGGCSSTAYATAKIDYTLGTSITQIPSSGKIANYKFNGNANDAAGINQGSLQNAPTLTTDRFGVSNAAYSFDGSTQYVSTSQSYTNPNDLSESIWFKTTTTNGGKLIGFGNTQTGGSTVFDRHIYMDNSGLVYFGVNPLSGRITINSTSSYNDGNWHLATATLSSTTGIVLYIDGTSVASSATPLGGQNNTGYYKIGYDAIGATWPSNPTSTYFNGALDDVLIYSRALTSTEVKTLYNGPDGPGQNGPVCVGNTLTFSAPTVGGATYSWTGPGTLLPSSSVQNPTMTYAVADAGTYTLNVTAGGCISRAYTIVFSNTSAAGQWTGNTNNSWQTAGNWCGGVLPTSTTDVIIPAVVTLPTNSATADVRNITINTSATLTNASTGILNVNGNFTNNGTFTDNSIYNSAGVVNFVGSSAQTISGATTFSNVTLNNVSGLTLNSTSTINGILMLTAGTLATGGNLNQNLYNGAISGTGSGATSGNIRFFKYIYGDRYHYLSSPIPGITVSDWSDNVLTTGHLFSYNETVKDTSAKTGWTAVNSGPLNNITGYALFFPRWYNLNTIDVTGNYTHGTASISSDTLTNTKTTVPVVKAAADGWNLMGNPYPSTIDWSSVGITKTGLDNAIYIWDGRTNRYLSYVSGIGTNGGTQYIGSMQGFFVKVSTAGGKGFLTISNSARITSTLKDVWRTEEGANKILRLTVANGADADETIIRFADEASEQFDAELDAYKLTNDSNVPSVFSVSPLADYSVNSLPSALTQKTIPLQLNVVLDADYQWTADLSGFASNESFTLEDRLLGVTQNLSDNPTYHVELDSGNYAGRFYLQYTSGRQSTVTANTSANNNTSGIEIGTLQQNVFLLFTNQSSGTANVAVFDALGKPVYNFENATIDAGRIDFALPDISNGVYVVKVQTAIASKAQQVFIQK
ncbi:MAG: C-terminal target protein [Chitinophagaceae bacterium]|nr:C-terminal target protein [Chitinophagaceae bacterium]